MRDDSGTPSVPAEGAAPTLNANHMRRVVSTFSYVDGLLNNVERLAHAQTAGRSPFAREQPDLGETEARLILALVATARQRMLMTVDHLGLPRPKANLSARWSMMTYFRSIDSSLADLTPQTLKGYGAIDDRSAAEVSAVAAEVCDLVARGRELLRPREGIRLQERLQSIDGPYGEVLRAAEQLSTSLGLVEARQLIAAAADRADTSTIDIGIFGRVSSGKSSLINALIGAPILPVGATPVTAVPTRVTHGDPAIEVRFTDGRRESIAPDALRDYATEAGNRDNVRRVDSIHIRAPQLPAGLALLDTPGVGSLSQGGPAQAFAWLPRCDLGIVLVAAGTPLGRDELALVGGLTSAGIEAEVLLSKSDLLPVAERDAAIEYVRVEVEQATGQHGMTVRPVSVVGEDARLLKQWRDQYLTPRVEARQVVAARARVRRVRALLDTLNGALVENAPLSEARVDIHRLRVQAEHDIVSAVEALENAVRETLTSAADAIVTAWRAGEDARSAARQAILATPNQALFRVRLAADDVLGFAGNAPNDADPGEAAARLPPLFDAPLLDDLPLSPDAGVLDRVFGHARATEHLKSLRMPLNDLYGTYANRIRAWGLERLEENFARAALVTPQRTDGVVPQLREFADLIDRHFPPQDGRNQLIHPEARHS